MFDELKDSYLSKKELIEKRLEEFSKPKTDDELFSELAFCLLTPQSKARLCWTSIEKLREKGLLYSDSASIRPWLNTVRFCNNKSRYIEEAQGKIADVKRILDKEPD
ncbi:DNA lyase, partial [Candidatus Woesearchaeota archaeon]|nr:DNA lyase [Candidatus Woesearchaeota archaeon]